MEMANGFFRGTCHLRKLKILLCSIPCTYGIKETDIAVEEGWKGTAHGVRKRYEIRNWAQKSHTIGCLLGRRMGPVVCARRSRWFSCALYSWEVAADVPTRLARARCHLAAKKTVPSAPSSSSPRQASLPLSVNPSIVARVHASPPRGSDTKLLSATRECTCNRGPFLYLWECCR